MLPEADYATTMDAMFNNPFNPEDDKRLFVVFYMHPHPDPVRTKEEGRPIFREQEYVRIIVPGDKESVVERPVYESDKMRFERQYLRFQKGLQEPLVGMPISQVAWISRAQCKELEYFGVMTLEQLADISDANAQKFMGINLLRTKARKYLERAKEDAPLQKMEAILAEKDAEIESLRQSVKDLGATVEKLRVKLDDRD